MRTLHRVFSVLLVASTALAGIAAAGCETDDSSTPLPPAAKDATTDQASSDGAPATDGAGDAAPPVEASTDAPPAETSTDGGGTGD
ncbi:MAG TPA: hypothetical protein VF765_05240 [Polyangiaceae bacterium]